MIIDRYLASKFLKLLFSILSTIIILINSIIFLDKGKDLLVAGASVTDLLKYLFYNIGYWISMLLPISIFMATVILTDRFARRGEMLAFLSSGRSIIRSFLSIFILGILMVIGHYFYNEQLAYHGFRDAEKIYSEITKKEKPHSKIEYKDLWLKTTADSIWRIERLGSNFDFLSKVTMYQFSEDGKIGKIIFAEKANKVKGSWVFKDLVIREFMPNGKINKTEKAKMVLNIDIEKLLKIEMFVTDPMMMSVADISNYLKSSTSLGFYDSNYPVEQQFKIAFVFLDIVLIFLGVAIGILSERHATLSTGVGGAVLIYVLYWSLLTPIKSIGKSGIISAYTAAYFPVASLFFLSLFFLKLERSLR